MYPILKLSETIQLPTYYLFNSLLLCALVLWIYTSAKKQNLSVDIALNISILLMIFGFWGGRLFALIYETPEYLSFENLFSFEKGGFVMYGGAIAAVSSAFIYLKIKKLSFWNWADFFTPASALGVSLSRISCFLNGCCYGKSCDLPWSVHGLHPTQLYSVVWDLGVFAFVMAKKKTFASHPGKLFLVWICLHSIGRAIIEQFRDDYRGSPIYGLSVSTWISFGLIALCLLTLKRAKHPNNHST